MGLHIGDQVGLRNCLPKVRNHNQKLKIKKRNLNLKTPLTVVGTMRQAALQKERFSFIETEIVVQVSLASVVDQYYFADFFRYAPALSEAQMSPAANIITSFSTSRPAPDK